MSDINFKKIQFSVLGIFIIIFSLLLWYLNTDYFIKKEYYKFKKLKFETTVSSKIDEHPIKGNKISLKNGPELIVYRALFDKLKIGDSVIKKVNSDSVYFFTSKEVIIDDYNEFLRKKYLNSLKK